MKCRIAELNIEILNRDPYLENVCGKYAAEFSTPDITLSANDADIAFEKNAAAVKNLSVGRLESVAICRKLGRKLHEYNSFLLHAATFEVENRGVAFFAKSGTGKYTHMLLWKKLFGEKLQIINGDKPIVKVKDGKPFAYGTPWCGKEGLSENKSVMLTDLCFIKRSEKNETRKLEKSEAFKLLLDQVAIPSGSINILKFLELLEATIENCNLWEISCNKETAAAEQSSKIILR